VELQKFANFGQKSGRCGPKREARKKTRQRIALEQGFSTLLRSRTTWATHFVNDNHFFQNNKFERFLFCSEE